MAGLYYTADGVTWTRTLGGDAPDKAPGRDALVYGTYKPVAGVTAGLVMPDATFVTMGSGGSIVLATPGATYTNTIFNGLAYIAAEGITFENCKFLGASSQPTSSRPLVKAHSSFSSGGMGKAHFIDCLFQPQTESWWVNAIDGGDFTVERCEIRRVVDGLGLTAVGSSTSMTRVYGCVIHDGAHYTWEGGSAGGDGHSDGQTHNDAIQLHRPKHVHIKGNYLGGPPATATPDPETTGDYPNTGMMIQQEVSSDAASAIEDVLIEENWFEGGAASVNIARKYGNTLPSVRVLNNRFAPRASGYYIIRPPAPYFAGTISGNVIEGTTTPVPIKNGGAGS